MQAQIGLCSCTHITMCISLFLSLSSFPHFYGSMVISLFLCKLLELVKYFASRKIFFEAESKQYFSEIFWNCVSRDKGARTLLRCIANHRVLPNKCHRSLFIDDDRNFVWQFLLSLHAASVWVSLHPIIFDFLALVIGPWTFASMSQRIFLPPSLWLHFYFMRWSDLMWVFFPSRVRPPRFFIVLSLWKDLGSFIKCNANAVVDSFLGTGLDLYACCI